MGELEWADIGILIGYVAVLLCIGFYFMRRSKTVEDFAVAGRSIPAWAAGLAIMSTYTSSISYIATPGKSFDSNWHPMIFALCIIPVTWLVCKYIIPYYQKRRLISVYEFLEEKLGNWARSYAAFSFLLYMVGRIAVILYLTGLLVGAFLPYNIAYIIVVLGAIIVMYTVLGGMKAIIWIEVIQSVIMLGGIIFCVAIVSADIFAGSSPLIQNAIDAGKFSFGSWDFSFSSRTIWVMIIYGITENLRNLMADQNYVQKYSTVATAEKAKRSLWIGMGIYIPLTAAFLYMGTALFSFYSGGGLPATITKGDQVFPHFIATQLPMGLKGLVVGAIVAAAMSTIDSGLNCSSTVMLLDFYKRHFKKDISEKSGMAFVRGGIVVWGALGTGFALLMIGAGSALDIWWTISGIFGGGILGLFLISLANVKIKKWQGIAGVAAGITFMSWATFARNLPAGWEWFECSIDTIIIGALGTFVMIAVILILCLISRQNRQAVASRFDRSITRIMEKATEGAGREK